MTLAGQVFDEWVALQSKVPQVIPANPDAIAIVRLFMEKLEQFSADEREAIVTAIRILTMPLIVWDEQRKAYVPEKPNGNADTR